jgi:membrane protein DedA with SNARE-associated domain
MWNALGGAIWGTGCVLLGYAFASALDVVGETLTWAPLAILAVVLVVAIVIHVRRKNRESHEAIEYARADAGGEG